MKYTREIIKKLIDQAEADMYGNAHDQLIKIDEDINVTDQRARQGMGMSDQPSSIDDDAFELLDEYMSTH